MKRTLVGLTLSLSLVSLAGCCCHNGCRRPTGACPVPPGGPIMAGPGPYTNAPPANFPGGPVPVNPNPTPFPMAAPTSPSPFPPSAPPPPPPPQQSFSPPPDVRSEFRWQPGPSPSHVQLLPPEPLSEPNTLKLPPVVEKSKTPEPPQNDPFQSLPVGIPAFAKAKDQIYVGRRPSLDDGLDWLQANKFRRVLQMRQAEEDDSADRKQVEKRGMKYLSLEVTPKTLTRETVLEFAQILRDEAGYPLFVYDRDSSLAGPMWYVYFRMVEQQDHEVSLIRARALGLRTDGDDAHRDMWLAVQRILEK